MGGRGAGRGPIGTYYLQLTAYQKYAKPLAGPLLAVMIILVFVLLVGRGTDHLLEMISIGESVAVSTMLCASLCL